MSLSECSPSNHRTLCQAFSRGEGGRLFAKQMVDEENGLRKNKHFIHSACICHYELFSIFLVQRVIRSPHPSLVIIASNNRTASRARSTPSPQEKACRAINARDGDNTTNSNLKVQEQLHLSLSGALLSRCNQKPRPSGEVAAKPTERGCLNACVNCPLTRSAGALPKGEPFSYLGQ